MLDRRALVDGIHLRPLEGTGPSGTGWKFTLGRKKLATFFLR
jgi:hypothetical protein